MRGLPQERVEDHVRDNGGRQLGSVSHSLSKAYGTMGIMGASRRGAISTNVNAAEKADGSG